MPDRKLVARIRKQLKTLGLDEKAENEALDVMLDMAPLVQRADRMLQNLGQEPWGVEEILAILAAAVCMMAKEGMFTFEQEYPDRDQADDGVVLEEVCSSWLAEGLPPPRALYRVGMAIFSLMTPLGLWRSLMSERGESDLS